MKTIDLSQTEKQLYIRNKLSFRSKVYRDRFLLLMFLPGLLYFIIFRYLPMFGVLIAFQDFDIFDGFLKSKFVGFKHFINFFNGPYFWMLMKNTILLNFYLIIFGFPIPIIFSILLNEIKSNYYKRIVQTVSYLPHFISSVVIVGMLLDFLSPQTGIISLGLKRIIGGDAIFFIAKPQYFRSIYVLMDIWRSTGWGTIIFMAALTGIDPTLYEASIVDGANRFQRVIYITLPGILPTIVIIFILKVGQILDVGFETIFLMQNPLNFGTSDVISTFVYRRGILGESGTSPNFSFATAVNLFQSAIGFIMVIYTNKLARRISEVTLW